MGGDQGNGLAMAIGIVMLLIILGCAFLMWLFARFLTRKVSPKRRGLVTALLTAAGLGIGWMVMTATFYESSFDPPPELRLTAAPGMDARWVVLLEETGRALFPSPLVSSALCAAALRSGSEAQRALWLPRLADGSAIGTVAILEASDHLAPEGVALAGRAEGDGFVRPKHARRLSRERRDGRVELSNARRLTLREVR